MRSGIVVSMRRLVSSVLLAFATVGVLAVPAGADSSTPVKTVLSYDYSDNNAPASASGDSFNVIIDVVAQKNEVGGQIRVVAVAPADSNDANLVCGWQNVVKGKVECSFAFPDSGVWAIKSTYAATPKSPVIASAVTQLRVAN